MSITETHDPYGTTYDTTSAATAHADARRSSAVEDLEDAEQAYRRVEPDALALREDEFTSLNVDVVSATSVILGVLSRVLPYRDRLALLASEFQIEHVDQLADHAKAAWYAAITNLPQAEPKNFQNLIDECTKLRAHLLTWATPLVAAQKFDQAALDQILAGSGNKDLASDVVALVALYRSKWSEVSGICAVTEEQLARGAVLGPAVFAAVSRRENKTGASLSDGSQKVRRFWTLADRSYDQCQRAIAFLEWGVVDPSSIVPSLRNKGGGRPPVGAGNAPATPDSPTAPATPPGHGATPIVAAPAAPVAPIVPQLGGNGGPFGH